MSDEPVDATPVILRQIQGTLAEHGRVLQSLSIRLEDMSRRLDEVRNGVIAALGLGKNADLRHDTVQQQIEELRRRLEALEEKV